MPSPPDPGTRTAKMSFVTVGVTSQLLLSASPNRVAIMIFGSTLGRVTFSNDNPAVLDNGPTVIQSASPTILDYNVVGEVVRKPFFAIAAVANSVVGIIEVLVG